MKKGAILGIVPIGAVLLVSFLGTRWNARGSIFAPLPQLDLTHDGQRRVAIVTGANTGLGLEIARGLYKTNYHVVMATRKLENGENARKQLLEEEGEAHGTGLLDVRQLDLASFKSVRAFASSLQEESVELLIANAGIWGSQELTQDKIGMTAQVNHYSHFLLSNLLIQNNMRNGGRIVLLSSLMANEGIDFTKDPLLLDSALLQSRRRGKLYGSSKLMNILHAQARSKRMPSTITVSVHPGVIKTLLHRSENDDSDSFFNRFISPLFYRSVAMARSAIDSTFGYQSKNHSKRFGEILSRNHGWKTQSSDG